MSFDRDRPLVDANREFVLLRGAVERERKIIRLSQAREHARQMLIEDGQPRTVCIVWHDSGQYTCHFEHQGGFSRRRVVERVRL